MFVRTVRDHGGLTPPKACATINGFVEFSLYLLFFYELIWLCRFQQSLYIYIKIIKLIEILFLNFVFLLIYTYIIYTHYFTGFIVRTYYYLIKTRKQFIYIYKRTQTNLESG